MVYLLPHGGDMLSFHKPCRFAGCEPVRELAMSISVDSLFAVPSEIADAPMVARLLSGVLDISAEEIETKLQGARTFVWLERKLPPGQVQRIEALNLRGIYFQKESV